MTLSMKRIIRIVKFVFSFLFSKINPLGYARYLGVMMGSNVNFLWHEARYVQYGALAH